MDNLRATIEVLFLRGNVELVLDQVVGVRASQAAHLSSQQRFVCAHQNDYPQRYNEDQTENIYKIAQAHWLRHPNAQGSPGDRSKSGGDLHPIYALVNFACKVLSEENDEPICKFEHLLRWRNLTLKLGEDIFSTAYLAYLDTQTSRQRHHFGWPSMLFNDNASLTDLFRRQKLCELHAHLKGSTQIFDLNWLSLMNHTLDRSDSFNTLLRSQLPDVLLEQNESRVPLQVAVIKAAALRAWLFEKLIVDQTPDPVYARIIHEKDEKFLHFYLNDLQCRINLLNWQYGHLYGNQPVDYAIPKNLPQRELDKHMAPTIHYGERRLLYAAFLRICRELPDGLLVRQYLYAYLIAKMALRKELVQINNRIGFKNFQTYEHRKTCFLKPGSIYERLVSNLAINSMLASGNVEYIEARITPARKSGDLAKSIQKNDAEIDNKYLKPLSLQTKWPVSTLSPEYKHHYILHFIKTASGKGGDQALLNLAQCRHYHLREQVKQQTLAINKLRCSSHSARHRIVGIDAASSEIECRPEVFATAFRFLKYYSYNPIEQYLYPDAIFRTIGRTYHVGEDFLDIADGLRAVDEVINFLNLGNGDRIGHGLVLGIDAKTYYESRNRTITMPSHDFLDNTAWMLNILPLASDVVSSALLQTLENWFYEEFDQIYGHNKELKVTPYHYFQAWKLRGDDPVHYKTRIRGSCSFTNFWQKAGINDWWAEHPSGRDKDAIHLLYHLYHYDPLVRSKGLQMVEKEVTQQYISAITTLQCYMRHKVGQLHLAIEVNPSSNDVIGEFKRYDKHPLLAFYKNGLTNADGECEQIHIIIGTDDQGIFSTALEQEYGLMALSQEKACNEQGERLYKPTKILEWVEHIAQMGFEHRFFKK